MKNPINILIKELENRIDEINIHSGYNEIKLSNFFNILIVSFEFNNDNFSDISICVYHKKTLIPIVLRTGTINKIQKVLLKRIKNETNNRKGNEN
jgi:hypothetical protein